MGRLISTEQIINNEVEVIDDSGAITDIKTYFNQRLKADMVAMLTEIRSEIERCEKLYDANNDYQKGVKYGLLLAKTEVQGRIVQQKINALEVMKNGKA